MNKLLKMDRYNIYNNSHMTDDAIQELADMISQNKNINLEEIFDMKKFSSKFCWINFVLIMERLPMESKKRGLPILFELLQDSNWPVFSRAVEALEKIDKEILIPQLKESLQLAYKEDDEMWIDNLQAFARENEIAIDIGKK